jgi:DNA helicase-2/ATP-dependent DNA helicase PcrA
MAGPGSGKTTATIERIVYLIQNGVNPDNIVYTTFSKDMADEGYKRILAKLPEVANTNMAKQVCTIHALCFRMLSWEGLKSEVAKEWQIKKALSEIIEEVWENNPEKPGYNEVLLWINNAKLNGLTANEDYSFYFQYMGNLAAYVHDARVKFDAQMEAQHLITFADMTYKVEQMLMRNRNFREKYQARFTHILVDEAQDTNAQALRILITLSLDHGKNTVYRN